MYKIVKINNNNNTVGWKNRFHLVRMSTVSKLLHPHAFVRRFYVTLTYYVHTYISILVNYKTIIEYTFFETLMTKKKKT